MSTPFKMKGWSPFTKEDDDFGDAPRKEKVIPMEGVELTKEATKTKKTVKKMDLSKVAYDKLPNTPAGNEERKRRGAQRRSEERTYKYIGEKVEKRLTK